MAVAGAPVADPALGVRSGARPDVRRAAGEISRSSKWWTSKVGPLMGVAYLALALVPRSAGDGVVRLVALLWSACLLATAAYVVNDWTDREADRRAGKRSATMGLAPAVVVALMVVPVPLAAAPWLALGLPPAGWGALAAIVVLPHLYSQPPLRLKERGAWGLVADTFLAHLSPTLFTLAAFDALVLDRGPAHTALVAGLLVWSAAVGLRGIIDHEIADAPADRVAGTRTWAVGVGEPSARRVGAVVLAVELAGAAVVAAALVPLAPVAVGLAAAALVAGALARWAGAWTRPLVATGRDEAYGVLWVSYGFWLPAVPLVALVARRPALAPLLLVHLVLFRSVGLPWIANVGHYAVAVVRVAWGCVHRAANAVRHRAWPFLRRDLWHRLRWRVGHPAASWVRHRLPDLARRAWYHGLWPWLHRTYHRLLGSARRTASRARRLPRSAGRAARRVRGVVR